MTFHPPSHHQRHNSHFAARTFLGAVLLLLALALPALAPVDAAGAPPPGATPATLVKVIDGDTIDVRIAGQVERVRYIGVDTPERGQPGYTAATDANRQLLGAGTLYLVRDVSDPGCSGSTAWVARWARSACAARARGNSTVLLG